MQTKRISLALIAIVINPIITLAEQPSTAERPLKLVVTIDRGDDLGQNFGSLFHATAGSFVFGAGFQNLYNTRYRADRHAIQFFIRPTGGERVLASETLPRPNSLCGTYLYGQDEIVRSTYGGVKAWNPETHGWKGTSSPGGTEETMRLGNGLLEFGDSTVRFGGRTILSPPDKGSYQLFFYANGHLCFYHVNRGDGPYRPYENDAAGFSKLHACPWSPEQSTVDLSQSIVLTLPVVGETTFAWGQLGRQIVTGSNIGGFYVFEEGRWRMLLKPELGVSYQLYPTMAFHDRLLMGQYPTGRLFLYDGERITDQPGWPPKFPGVSGSAREAQTTVIYGGDVFVGVWPWGELWRYNPDSKRWAFARRVFDHPDLSDKVTHPYDVENSGNPISNLWGQRITSLVTSGPHLFLSTSAKAPCPWEPEKFPFLAPDNWQSYGSVYRLSLPGHLGATTRWTGRPTTLEFTLRGAEISITQDGEQLATTTLSGSIAEKLTSLSGFDQIIWGDGIYGRFNGVSIAGSSSPQQ